MADTIGSVVDKLITCNIKLFRVQDEVHGAADAGEGLDADTVRKLHSLNLQRNALMVELDTILSNAVSSGRSEVDDRIKLV